MITQETYDYIYDTIYDLIREDILANVPAQIEEAGLAEDDILDITETVWKDLKDDVNSPVGNVYNTAVLHAVNDACDALEALYGKREA